LPPGWRTLFAEIPPRSVIPWVAEKQLQEPNQRHRHQIDLRKWLEQYGIQIPPGGFAVYDITDGDLVCVAPAETVELIEEMFKPMMIKAPPQIRIEATLVSFQCESTARIRDLPYARLQSVAGKTWRDEENLTLTTSSGQRSAAFHRARDAAAKATALASPNGDLDFFHKRDQAGTALEIEPVITPDAGVQLNYHFLRRFEETGRAQELDAQSQIIGDSESPLIANLWPQKLDAPGAGKSHLVQFYALVLRAEILTDDGVPMGQAVRENAQRVRQRIKAAMKTAADDPSFGEAPKK
jgi:hypothetical protein